MITWLLGDNKSEKAANIADGTSWSQGRCELSCCSSHDTVKLFGWVECWKCVLNHGWSKLTGNWADDRFTIVSNLSGKFLLSCHYYILSNGVWKILVELNLGSFVFNSSYHAIFSAFHLSLNCGFLWIHFANSVLSNCIDFPLEWVIPTKIIDGLPLRFFKSRHSSRNRLNFLLLWVVEIIEFSGFGIDDAISMIGSITKNFTKLGSDFAELISDSNFSILADHKSDKLLTILVEEHLEDITHAAFGSHDKICW